MEGPLSGEGTDDRLEVVGLQGRISETLPYARGVRPLTEALARRGAGEPRLVGSPTDLQERRGHDVDLDAARKTLGAIRSEMEASLAAARAPLLIHGDCAVALATLPALAAPRPAARVLWLDAHGDFNAPETSPSGWLGGMGLAGACGVWDAGLGSSPFPPERVTLCGARDLDVGERNLLAGARVEQVALSPDAVVAALAGEAIYVHLDPDVLDPEVFPQEFPAPGGGSPAQLRAVLEAVAERCELIGLEIAAFYAPEDEGPRTACATLVADCVAPLLACARPR